MGDPVAVIECGRLLGQMPIADPAAGISELRFSGVHMPGVLLRVAGAGQSLAASEDTYARGEDRVSTHPATDAFPFRTQLYWSARSLAAGGVAITLTVSLQTDLLDTSPELSLTTRIDNATAKLLGGDVCRLDAEQSPSVVIAPHPSDMLEFNPTVRDGEVVLQFTPPFLEKGVIRRCRVAAILLPHDTDDVSVAKAIEEFAALPLPLAT
ncbi:MAG: hypothetical protein AAF266_01425 [Planctomycetota bacterium]